MVEDEHLHESGKDDDPLKEPIDEGDDHFVLTNFLDRFNILEELA